MVDLDGNEYNKNTAKEKILILQCWFIHSKPYVAEIPGANQLLNQFKNKKDILIVNLAFNPAKERRNFLMKINYD